jgi:hypothetical protein
VSDQEFVLGLVALTGAFALAVGAGYLIHAWLKSRASARVAPDRMLSLQEQIAQLQNSVDSISIEVERISEAQRFTTSLLAERPDMARLERGEERR